MMEPGFDLATLRTAVAQHSVVVRVVITGFKGSSPRETGASMLVWAGGQSGTIGGGALEFEVVARAQNLLTDTATWARFFHQTTLGPALGQCCGGTVSVLAERFTASELTQIETDSPFARPIKSGMPPDSPPPLALQRLLRDARGAHPLSATKRDDWFVEPLTTPQTSIWIYGAGHVGRAIVNAAHGLPFDITWIDTDRARFPEVMPQHASPLIAANPSDAVRHAPADAHHIVLTYSHALDLEICHQVLGRDFGFLGLIGSETKHARFISRLSALGHSNVTIARLKCPIGDPALGKAPAAIALGTVLELLKMSQHAETRHDTRSSEGSVA